MRLATQVVGEVLEVGLLAGQLRVSAWADRCQQAASGSGAFQVKPSYASLGIRTTDLASLVDHIKSQGFEFRKEITELARLKYVMAAGPDGILLELFETDLF